MSINDFKIRRLIRQKRLDRVLSKDTMGMSLHNILSLKLKKIEEDIRKNILIKDAQIVDPNIRDYERRRTERRKLIEEPKQLEKHNVNLIKFLQEAFKAVHSEVTDLYSDMDKTIDELQKIDVNEIIVDIENRYSLYTGQEGQAPKVIENNIRGYLNQLMQGRDLLKHFASYILNVSNIVKQLAYQPRRVPNWIREWILKQDKRKREEDEYKQFLEFKNRQKGRAGYSKFNLSFVKKAVNEVIPILDKFDQKFDEIIARLDKVYEDFFTPKGPIKKATDQLLTLYGVGTGDIDIQNEYKIHIAVLKRLFGDIGQIDTLENIRDAYVNGFSNIINSADVNLMGQEFFESISTGEEGKRLKELENRQQNVNTVPPTIAEKMDKELSDFIEAKKQEKIDLIEELINKYRLKGYMQDVELNKLKTDLDKIDSDLDKEINIVNQFVRRERNDDDKLDEKEIVGILQYLDGKIKEYYDDITEKVNEIKNMPGSNREIPDRGMTLGNLIDLFLTECEEQIKKLKDVALNSTEENNKGISTLLNSWTQELNT